MLMACIGCCRYLKYLKNLEIKGQNKVKDFEWRLE
jgi:hypothetical protein